MKTLYLDCGMGAAGDMLTAALLELLPEPDYFLERLNGLGIPGVSISRERVSKCGVFGTHISVKVHGEEEESVDVSEFAHTHSHDPHDHAHAHEHSHDHAHGYEHPHDHEHAHDHIHPHDHAHRSGDLGEHDHLHVHTHHHSGLSEMEHLVAELPIPESVRADVLAVYGLIAEAESVAHGVPVHEVHFHEVGAMDAVADITAACLLMRELNPDEVIVSPIRLGTGQVRCAHGILPVPAPATAYILRDVPVYGGTIRGELCTPTGAALLKHFATGFGAMPVMKVTRIGYGMGKKDFEAANCVRAMWGETQDQSDLVLELSCNVDDMTAEAVGFALERLFEGGALEVYTIPIGMKKSRPGTLIRVMCRELDREKIIALLFRYTTTIGIREAATRRYVLNRKISTLTTPYGEVRRKESTGYGVTRRKYEYEDLAEIARKKEISLEDARCLIEALHENEVF